MKRAFKIVRIDKKTNTKTEESIDSLKYALKGSYKDISGAIFQLITQQVKQLETPFAIWRLEIRKK